jgi:hypothetical protein
MTTTQPALFERSAPTPTEAAYRAFSLDTKEEVAASAFQQRYGQPPEFVFESHGNLLCGPIPGEVL